MPKAILLNFYLYYEAENLLIFKYMWNVNGMR